MSRTRNRIVSSFVFLGFVAAALGGCGKDNVVVGQTGGGAGGPGASGGSGGSSEGAVIDDLEDGDTTVSAFEGRTGVWRVVGDESATAVLTVEPDPSGGSAFAAHVVSPAFSVWGGGAALTFLSSPSPNGYDASKYAGFRFRAKSKAPTVLRVSIPDQQTEQSGGLCADCWDHFATDVSLGTEFEDYLISFKTLGQLGFGDDVESLRTTALFGLQFHVAAGEEVDFWLDDLEFVLPGDDVPVIEEPPPRVVPDETPVEMHGQLRVDGTRIVDEAGDPVQLKGISSMWLHWENDGYAKSLEALEWVRDQWGVNVVRAAMGIEPAGAYLSDPERWTSEVETIVDNAIEAGVYVIIDWHDHEAEAHQSEAEAFFAAMSAKYGDIPNVLYEPYNEPLDVEWSTTLKPYHEAIVGKIREVDPDNLIILGTGQWSQKVDDAALDPLVGENLLYTLHFYACTHTAWLRSRAEAALAAGLPLFVTEWGATHADGGLDGIVCDAQAEQWTTWMRDRGIGWTAWKLDGCLDASCLLRTGAPVDGPWTTEWLQGHGYFVREKIMEE